MNNLQVFKFQQNYLDYAVLNNEPLFNLNNIANILNISNPRTSIDVNDNDYVIKLDSSVVGLTYNRNLNNRGELFLTEAGLYKLIMTSKKKEAETFQKWVVKEVLPSIRKTGTYSINNNIQQDIYPGTYFVAVFNNKEINIITDREHEFLISTVDVARGYNVYASTVRKHFKKHSDLFKEDVHYKYLSNKFYWTKKGILQLSFLIKGVKSLVFKDWINRIVINHVSNDRVSNTAMQQDNLQFVKSLAYLIDIATNSNAPKDDKFYESIKQASKILYNNIKNL